MTLFVSHCSVSLFVFSRFPHCSLLSIWPINSCSFQCTLNLFGHSFFFLVKHKQLSSINRKFQSLHQRCFKLFTKFYYIITFTFQKMRMAFPTSCISYFIAIYSICICCKNQIMFPGEIFGRIFTDMKFPLSSSSGELRIY